MSVKNRIKDFLKLEKISISDFEKSINSSNGYVNSISKSVGLDKLELIIENYSTLNIEWLLTGKGEMLKTAKEEVTTPTEATPTATNCQETKALAEERAYIIELQKKEIGRLEQELATLQRTLQTKKTI